MQEVQSLLSVIQASEDELEISPIANVASLSADVEPLPSDSIPGYRIVKEIHRGGQGVVYQAIQLSTKRKVAVKVMLDGPFAGPASKRRFEREVELVGSLRHRGIVPVFDSGNTQGKYFFVMEYVRGEILSDYVQKNKLSLRGLLSLFSRVCAAIAYAHQKGVIHRDLKPSNILVDDLGEPRIVDFGLAKVGGPDAEKDLSQLMSVTGQIMGTPSYMSPEQAAGNQDRVDMRSDVYSLGIVLFEMVTGTLPYKLESTVPESLHAIQFQQPPSPRSLNSKINRDAETIVLKAISKEQSRRYPTAGALGDDIDRYLNGEPIEARRDSLLYLIRKSVAKHFAATAAAAALLVLFLAALILGWTLYWSGEKAREKLAALSRNLAIERDTARELRDNSQQQLYFAQMNLASQALSDSGGIGRVEELTDLWKPNSTSEKDRIGWEWFLLRSRCDLEQNRVEFEKQVWAGAISPDGRYFACGGDSKNIIVQPMDGSADKADLGAHRQHIRAVAWSPDGRFLATGSPDGTVFIFDTRSRKKFRDFRFDGQVLAISWHPRQPIISVGCRDQVVAFKNVETGKTIACDEKALHSVQALAHSPDGKLLAIGNWGLKENLEIWDVKSRQRLFSQSRDSSVFAVQFSPDGKLLATADSAGQVTVARVTDLKSGKEAWTRDLKRPVWTLAWSPDSSAIATAGEDRLIQIWNGRRGDPIRVFEGHTAPIWALDWSADGHTLLSASHDRTVRLWNPQATLGNRVFITQPVRRPDLAGVCWCGKSRNIAIASLAFDVFIVDQITGERVANLPLMQRSHSVHCSNDGSKVVASSEDGVYWWSIEEPNEKHTIDQLRGFHLSAKWCPQAKRIAACGKTGSVTIWDAETESLVARWDAPAIYYCVDWSPDGSRIATASSAGISVVDLGTNEPATKITAKGTSRSIAWHPNGQQVAVARDSGIVAIYDALSGALVHEMNDHVAKVQCVAWSPDGTRLASASDDGSVRVWDTRSGVQAIQLKGHEGRVNGLDWSPDGQQLVSVGSDSQIRIWDAQNGYEYLKGIEETRF